MKVRGLLAAMVVASALLAAASIRLVGSGPIWGEIFGILLAVAASGMLVVATAMLVGSLSVHHKDGLYMVRASAPFGALIAGTDLCSRFWTVAAASAVAIGVLSLAALSIAAGVWWVWFLYAAVIVAVWGANYLWKERIEGSPLKDRLCPTIYKEAI